MPPIRFLVSVCYIKLVAINFFFGKIMSSYSYYKKKKLVYIIIIALFGRQPSSYIKYTKLNMYLSYNIKLVSNTKYLYFMRSYSL